MFADIKPQIAREELIAPTLNNFSSISRPSSSLMDSFDYFHSPYSHILPLPALTLPSDHDLQYLCTAYPSSASSGLSSPRASLQASPQNFTFVTLNHLFGDDSILPSLPPMQQVERTQVTSTATQQASSRRRTSAAKFTCPVSGCGAFWTIYRV